VLDFGNYPAIFSHVKYLSSELIYYLSELIISSNLDHHNQLHMKCQINVFKKILLVDLFTIAGTGKPYPVVKLYEGNG